MQTEDQKAMSPHPVLCIKWFLFLWKEEPASNTQRKEKSMII